MDIASVNDYGDHYILGPIFIFISEAFSVTFGVYSGVYMIPVDKKKAFWAFVIFWGLVLLLLSFFIGFFYVQIDWTTGRILRTATEVAAQLVGLVFAGGYIWKEQNAIEKKYLLTTDNLKPI